MRRVRLAHLLTATATARSSWRVPPRRATPPGPATPPATHVGRLRHRPLPTTVVSQRPRWRRPTRRGVGARRLLRQLDHRDAQPRRRHAGRDAGLSRRVPRPRHRGRDLDGDGDNDLAVSSRGHGFDNDVVDLYLNQGAGGFTRTTTTGGHAPRASRQATSMPTGIRPRAGELLGRGRDDQRAGNAGDATFAAEEQTVVGQRVHDAVIGDFQGGGAVEIAAVVPDPQTNGYAVHVLASSPGARSTRTAIRSPSPCRPTVAAAPVPP